MNTRRTLILMVTIFSIFIANSGVGFASHSTLINSNNTTASYSNLNVAYEQTVSYSNPSSESLIYSTFTSVPPTIDGSLSYGEWGEPVIIDTLRYSNDSINYETHDMYVYFINDNNYLYIAAKIINDDYESDLNGDWDKFEIWFDGDNNGIIEPNEDIKQFTNLLYGDWFYEGEFEGYDTWRSDASLDGEGVASHSNHALGDYTYELKIPLNSGDVNDFAITSDNTIGFKIVYSEYYYDSSEEEWICDGTEDSWPNNEDRFDGANYGKLKLSSSDEDLPQTPSVYHQYSWYADYDGDSSITRNDGLVIGVLVDDPQGLTDISSVTVDASQLGLSSTLSLIKNPGGAWDDSHYMEALDLSALDVAATSGTIVLPVTVEDTTGLSGTGTISVTIKEDINPEVIHSVSWSDAGGNTTFIVYPWDLGTSHIASVKLDAAQIGLWDDLTMNYDAAWGGYSLWAPATAGTFSATPTGTYNLNVDLMDTSGYSGIGTLVYTK